MSPLLFRLLVLATIAVYLIPSGFAIIGGRRAYFSEAPHQLFFIIKTEFGDDTIDNTFKCGGSVATVHNTQVFITSAQCVLKKGSRNEPVDHRGVVLFAGDFKISHPWPLDMEYCNVHQLRDVKRIIIHPEFNPDTLENDLAIMFPKKNFDKSDYVEFVTLPTLNTNLGPVITGILSGWGARGSTAELSDFLYIHKNLTTMTDNECKGVAKDPQKIDPDRQLCIPGFGSGGVGTCRPDRGSPYVAYARHGSTYLGSMLLGIVSYETMSTCGEPLIPSVLLRMQFYTDWIQRTVLNQSK